MTRIIQLGASFTPFDAMSTHTFKLTEAMEDAGFEVEMYANAIGLGLEKKVKHINQLSPKKLKESLVIYQCGAWSEVANILLENITSVNRPSGQNILGMPNNKLIVDYHNLTPGYFFAKWQPEFSIALSEARNQVRNLADVTQLAIAKSNYSNKELEEFNFKDTKVIPLLYDEAQLGKIAPDSQVLDELKSTPNTKWLFVGSSSPQKRHDILIHAFWYYKQLFDTNAELYLVGGGYTPEYEEGVDELIVKSGLARDIHKMGSVSDSELQAYYKGCDVYVSSSQHEGFCSPLVEAMFHGLPIVAHKHAAIPDTLGDAGLCIEGERPDQLAAGVWEILHNDILQKTCETNAVERLEKFSIDRTVDEYIKTIKGVISK